MKTTYKIALILFISGTLGCEKSLDVKMPMGSYTTKLMFANMDAAHNAMRGIYEDLTGSLLVNSAFQGTLTRQLGLSADELVLGTYSNEAKQLYDNQIFSNNSDVLALWKNFYNYIYQCNRLIEGVTESEKLALTEKELLIGEASFIRALSYFYLVNIFGNVPLTISSDYIKNSSISVSKPEEVYAQIISDLKYAQIKMGEQYTAAGSRFRANKWAATALLARVYLYQKDWVNAEAQATAVISASNLYKLETLDRVWMSSSMESILALDNQGGYTFTLEATLVSGASSTNGGAHLSPFLISQFETGDERATKWLRPGTGAGVGTIAPYKFKNFNFLATQKECVSPLRLAEQFLIRAEARAMQDNLNDALQDLDKIRSRAGAVADHSQSYQTIEFSNPMISKEELIDEIYKERLLEFLAEMGHRWLDAKRSGKSLSDFFEGRKPGIKETAGYFPIPYNEIGKNKNLKQNEGYD